jgi:hypothetical protein
MWQHRMARILFVTCCAIGPISCGEKPEVVNQRSEPYVGPAAKSKVEIDNSSDVIADNSQAPEAQDSVVTTVAAPDVAATVPVAEPDRPDPAPDPIISLPENNEAILGSPATFRAVVMEGTPATFVWKKDGTIIPNETFAELKFSATTAANRGKYEVNVTIPGKPPISKQFDLSVFTFIRETIKPIIDVQTGDQTAVNGGTAVFSIQARANPQPTFQWRKDGVDIVGATDRVLTIPKISATDKGLYTVNVANSVGVTVSRASLLEVVTRQVLPKIVSFTKAQTKNASEEFGLKVEATGTHLKFKWYRNGVEVAGQERDELKFAYASAENDGEFMVEVSNVLGKVTEKAVVTVTDTDAGAVCANGYCVKLESNKPAYNFGNVGYEMKGWACKVGSAAPVFIKTFGFGTVQAGAQLRTQTTFGFSDRRRTGIALKCGLAANTPVVGGFRIFFHNSALLLHVAGITNATAQIGVVDAAPAPNTLFVPGPLAFIQYPPFVLAVLPP